MTAHSLPLSSRCLSPDFDISQPCPEKEVVGISEAKHQAFGYMAHDRETGRSYCFWRSGTEHGTAGAGQIRMRRFKSDLQSPMIEADGSGNYTIVLSPDSGRDLRDPEPCVDPATGHLVVVFADVPSGTGDTYFRYIKSTDGGETFSAPVTFKTIPFAYARVYGGLKIQPSTDPDCLWEMVTTAYYQTQSNPNTYVVDYFVTRNCGGTWSNSQDLGESYIADEAEGANSETALAGVSPSVWFAISRGNDDLHLKISTDGRKTWTAWEKIAWSDNGVHVAPDAAIVSAPDGRKALLIAATDRGNDWVEWSCPLVESVLKYGQGAILPPIAGHATSNAYPGVVDLGDGNAVFSFTREYSGYSYASFHIGLFNYGRLITRRPGFKVCLSEHQTTFTTGNNKVKWASASKGWMHGARMVGNTIILDVPGRWNFYAVVRLTGGNEDGELQNHMIYRAPKNGSYVIEAAMSDTKAGTFADELPISGALNCAFGDQIETYVNAQNVSGMVITKEHTQTFFIGEYLGEYGS